MATVPARKREARAQRPYVVCSCRSRQAASWPRISSYAALSKRVAVRVNGGLGGTASGEKSSATMSIETMAEDSDSHRCERCRTGQDPERRENVAQRSSPLRHKAKQGDGGRGTGAERPPDPTKGPRRWKAPQDVTSHRLSRVGGHGDLGGFLTRETIAKGSPELERRKAERRPCRHSAEEGEATEVSEARSVGWRRGSKMPTLGAHAPSKDDAAQQRGNMAARVQQRSAEAFSGVVKHSVPRSYRTEPKTPWGVHAAKVA